MKAKRVLAILAVIAAACAGGDVADTTSNVPTSTTRSPNTTTSTTAASPPVIEGTVFLRQSSNFNSSIRNQVCFGSPNSRFADIQYFASVVVRNGEGDVIGTDNLGRSEKLENPDTGRTDACTFPFEVQLAESANSYLVSVAGHDLPIYSHKDLEESDWQIVVLLDE